MFDIVCAYVVGSMTRPLPGRLLFSLEWQDADYDRLLQKMLEACEAMHKGGWWAGERPGIKRGRADGHFDVLWGIVLDAAVRGRSNKAPRACPLGPSNPEHGRRGRA